MWIKTQSFLDTFNYAGTSALPDATGQEKGGRGEGGGGDPKTTVQTLGFVHFNAAF